MSLFNFARPESNDGQKVQLIVNEEVIEIPAAEAQGLTVRQLFDKFASNVCDTSRINRFINAGRIVAGTSNVEAGCVYSGTVSSESKGL